MVNTRQLRKLFRDYTEEKGYKPASPDSLVSDTFPTCFTLSGGPNFVDRYLRQEKLKPENSFVIQPCHRFWDAENVGDGTHLSFFEMAVTNSFDGVPRNEMYRHHFDFLTKELGLDPDYFTVSAFGGGSCYGTEFKQDEEALEIWKDLRLRRYSVQRGFGPDPRNGRMVNSSFVANSVEPVGGPRTEICYGNPENGLEIWTSVLYNTFVDFNKEKNEFIFSPIGQSTISAGFGLERVAQAVNGLASIDEVYSGKHSRDPVVSDHVRGMAFLAKDGAFELKGDENSGRKTLLNRYVRNFFHHLGEYDREQLKDLISETIDYYKEDYTSLREKGDEILEKIESRGRRLNMIPGNH